MTAAPVTTITTQRVRIRSGSGEEAGSRPFDEFGSINFLLIVLIPPVWRIQTLLQIIGSANHNMRPLANQVKTQFHCRNRPR